jgi:NitT/TauT family transport system permease protein
VKSFRIPQFGAARQAEGKAPGSLPLADVAVGLGTLCLLYVAARVGAESLVKFSPPDIIPKVNLDPRNLPNYAARSTLQMFIGLERSTTDGLIVRRTNYSQAVLLILPSKQPLRAASIP